MTEMYGKEEGREQDTGNIEENDTRQQLIQIDEALWQRCMEKRRKESKTPETLKKNK